MTEKFHQPVVRIDIPDETTEEMLQDSWLKEAVWALADVITWMQETVDLNIWIKNSNETIKKD